MSYTQWDAEQLKRKIERLLPQAYVETRDYGFAVDVRVGDKACVACQPQWDQMGQPEIFRSIDEIKQLLSLR